MLPGIFKDENHDGCQLNVGQQTDLRELRLRDLRVLRGKECRRIVLGDRALGCFEGEITTKDTKSTKMEFDEFKLLTHMKLAGIEIGLLINLNNTRLKDGIKRFVL